MPTHKNTAPRDGMTAQQELFCVEYLKDLNATQAAIRAGYSVNGTSVTASKLLAKANIQELIYTMNQKRLNEVSIDANFVLGELFKIASTDVGDCLQEDGSMKPMSEIPKHLRMTISSFEMIEYFEGFGQDREQVGLLKKVKFWSKDKALENLGKHLKLFSDKLEIEGKLTLEDILSKSRK